MDLLIAGGERSSDEFVMLLQVGGLGRAPITGFPDIKVEMPVLKK